MYKALHRSGKYENKYVDFLMSEIILIIYAVICHVGLRVHSVVAHNVSTQSNDLGTSVLTVTCHNLDRTTNCKSKLVARPIILKLSFTKVDLDKTTK
jgi:hypothetical protein